MLVYRHMVAMYTIFMFLFQIRPAMASEDSNVNENDLITENDQNDNEKGNECIKEDVTEVKKKEHLIFSLTEDGSLDQIQNQIEVGALLDEL